jgi:hypothetical protein
MGVLAAIARTTQIYPVLLPLILLAVCIAIWARRRRRWWLMSGSVVLAAVVIFLYTGREPIGAMDLRLVPARESAANQVPDRRFHPPYRLHSRFPEDFPVPSFFLHEHTRGHARHGALTVRFRFRGEPVAAVADLAEIGFENGWGVENRAPHRLVFRKDRRVVEAWFGFPGHALVLDIPDPR